MILRTDAFSVASRNVHTETEIRPTPFPRPGISCLCLPFINKNNHHDHNHIDHHAGGLPPPYYYNDSNEGCPAGQPPPSPSRAPARLHPHAPLQHRRAARLPCCQLRPPRGRRDQSLHPAHDQRAPSRHGPRRCKWSRCVQVVACAPPAVIAPCDCTSHPQPFVPPTVVLIRASLAGRLRTARCYCTT